jgi:hypothetical protein
MGGLKALSLKISAFGALNQDSYEMFRTHVVALARSRGADVSLVTAGPYPNMGAVPEPGRPLRAEALEDEGKRQELLKAVAADARRAGADGADVRCMPCMSMVGFHDGIEKALGLPILRLADAIAKRYEGVSQIGVIHMRPAKKRIEEIFGARAVTPDDAQAARLLAAEEEAKRIGHGAPVEAVMREIADSWRGAGLGHVLFARADAPFAERGEAGRVPGLEIDSYFGILARAVLDKACGP